MRVNLRTRTTTSGRRRKDMRSDSGGDSTDAQQFFSSELALELQSSLHVANLVSRPSWFWLAGAAFASPFRVSIFRALPPRVGGAFFGDVAERALVGAF